MRKDTQAENWGEPDRAWYSGRTARSYGKLSGVKVALGPCSLFSRPGMASLPMEALGSFSELFSRAPSALALLISRPSQVWAGGVQPSGTIRHSGRSGERREGGGKDLQPLMSDLLWALRAPHSQPRNQGKR